MLRSPPTRIGSGARNPTFWKSRVSGWTSKRSISDFLKQVKGSSSHFINHEIRPDFLFKWQGSYGALMVSKSGVDDLCEYIDRQGEHHRRKSLIPDWEPI
jgi:putative transposase